MPLYTRYKLPSYRKSYPLFCDFRTSFCILYDSIGSFIALQFVILVVSICYQKQKNNFQYSSKKNHCVSVHYAYVNWRICAAPLKKRQIKSWDLCILFPELFSDCSLVYWEGCDLWRWKVKWETPTTRDNSMRQSLTTRRLENLDDSLIHFLFF